MTSVTLTINGQKVTADVEPRMLLVKFLREHLRMTGTHVGCDTTQCGACTILFNGDAVKSCTMLVVQADGGEVEGSAVKHVSLTHWAALCSNYS